VGVQLEKEINIYVVVVVMIVAIRNFVQIVIRNVVLLHATKEVMEFGVHLPILMMLIMLVIVVVRIVEYVVDLPAAREKEKRVNTVVWKNRPHQTILNIGKQNVVDRMKYVVQQLEHLMDPMFLLIAATIPIKGLDVAPGHVLIRMNMLAVKIAIIMVDLTPALEH
jgi:hypothetical protein